MAGVGRIVLIKGIDAAGITFFTNYQSRKGRALAAHPYASVVFFWPELERQVRIEGAVEKISDQESEDYFRSRPLSSRLGAWASPQSDVIPNREWLEVRQKNLQEAFPAESSIDPPKPEHWGGYRFALMNLNSGKAGALVFMIGCAIVGRSAGHPMRLGD